MGGAAVATRSVASARPDRWLILAGFALLTACTQWLWLAYAPITTQTHQIMAVSEGAVGDLAGIFPFVYVILALPAGRWLDTRFARALGLGGHIIDLLGMLVAHAYLLEPGFVQLCFQLRFLIREAKARLAKPPEVVERGKQGLRPGLRGFQGIPHRVLQFALAGREFRRVVIERRGILARGMGMPAEGLMGGVDPGGDSHEREGSKNREEDAADQNGRTARSRSSGRCPPGGPSRRLGAQAHRRRRPATGGPGRRVNRGSRSVSEPVPRRFPGRSGSRSRADMCPRNRRRSAGVRSIAQSPHGGPPAVRHAAGLADQRPVPPRGGSSGQRLSTEFARFFGGIHLAHRTPSFMFSIASLI